MKVSVEIHEKGNIWGEHLGQACMKVNQCSLSRYLPCPHGQSWDLDRLYVSLHIYICTHTYI